MKIDVHAHYVPPSCLDIMGRRGGGPQRNLPDCLSDLDVRVMLGSDYPFGMGDARPPSTVAAVPHASDAEKDAMYGGNAVHVFGLEEALAG